MRRALDEWLKTNNLRGLKNMGSIEDPLDKLMQSLGLEKGEGGGIKDKD